MGTPLEFVTAAVVKILAQTNADVNIGRRLDNDFTITKDTGVLRGTLSVVGQSVDSNINYTVVTYSFDIIFHLLTPSLGGVYLDGKALLDQAVLTKLSFWRTIAGVYEVIEGGEPEIELPPDRVGNVISYSISVTVALEP